MKKKHMRVLDEIQSRVPKKLMDKLMRTEPLSPTIEKVAKLALKDPDFDAGKKLRLKHVMDAGHLSKQIEVVDREVESQLDKWYDKEIDKAIKKGLLPAKIDDPFVRKLQKLARENEKKQRVKENGKVA